MSHVPKPLGSYKIGDIVRISHDRHALIDSPLYSLNRKEISGKMAQIVSRANMFSDDRYIVAIKGRLSAAPRFPTLARHRIWPQKDCLVDGDKVRPMIGSVRERNTPILGNFWISIVWPLRVVKKQALIPKTTGNFLYQLGKQGSPYLFQNKITKSLFWSFEQLVLIDDWELITENPSRRAVMIKPGEED